MTTPALLVLADGSVFHGTSIGYEGSTSGEVVFNTSMTGYQEILTDPSYCKQIVTLTYPHIGNTGTNAEDEESRSVYAAGLIIRDLPLLHSNFRASESLHDYLVRNKTVAIADIDTRRLTVVPAQTSAEDVLALNPDGVFLSNGPGDPEPCTYAIEAVQKLMASGKPIFGICLGHQLISLAIGAKTLKMHFSHHGANHPVQDLDSGKVVITSQNHGFAVDADTLPANTRITHKSLFDSTLQGIELTDKPVFCFQGHPEASPGPQDVGYLFDKFIDNMKAAKQ